MCAASGDRGSLARSFTDSKPGDGLLAFADNASVTVVNPSGDALTTVASILLNAKVVRLENASLTLKQVHAFCDHVELHDLGLRFMTSKVMERVPVPDWKTGWEVSTILEALRECYPQQV